MSHACSDLHPNPTTEPLETLNPEALDGEAFISLGSRKTCRRILFSGGGAWMAVYVWIVCRLCPLALPARQYITSASNSTKRDSRKEEEALPMDLWTAAFLYA